MAHQCLMSLKSLGEELCAVINFIVVGMLSSKCILLISKQLDLMIMRCGRVEFFLHYYPVILYVHIHTYVFKSSTLSPVNANFYIHHLYIYTLYIHVQVPQNK